MGRCKFNEQWKEGVDENGLTFKLWLKKHSENEGFCVVCNKSFSVAKGHQAVVQHSKGQSHKSNCRIKLSSNQLRLTTQESSVSKSSIKIFDVRERSTKAELIWALKVISADFSAAASCDGIVETFKGMFGEGVPPDFSMSSTKLRYYVTDALAPYFKLLQKEDMQGVLYSLWYDETTNAANKKEFQTGIRYWSEVTGCIESQHLETFFIGSATGKDLAGKIDIALKNSGLPYSKMIMLGSDGPNVNKTVSNIVNETVLTHRQQRLLDIGTCNIHTVHNAFRKGLTAFGDETSELVFALHHFFSGWPSRRQEFSEVQAKVKVPQHSFVKHVPSRWLTLEQASERVLEQWDACRYYFLQHIPKHKNSLMQKTGYKAVVKFLKKPTMKAELMFVISSAKVFSQVTHVFQKEEPLIHVLYDELNSLLKTLVGRSCKSYDHNNLFSAEKLLPPHKVVLSEEIKKELNQLSPQELTFFQHNAQQHYKEAAEHIMKRTSVNCPLLKAFQCLQPQKRKKAQSLTDIVEISKALPLEIRTDILQDEWRLLQLQQDEESSDKLRIDHYWRQFLQKTNSSGNSMFPTVSKIVKAALCVSHGNADVERLFSCSARILTEDRSSLSERTLNAFLTVKTVLKKYKGKPENIPITKELLSLARTAYQRYKDYLEEKKKWLQEEEKVKREKEERRLAEKKRVENLQEERKQLKKDEEILRELQKQEREENVKMKKLLEEANSRLKNALKQKDMEEAGLAQAMLEGVKAVERNHSVKRRRVEDLQNSISKRKSKMISNQISNSKDKE